VIFHGTLDGLCDDSRYADLGSVQKNSGTRGAALARCAGLGVADIPDDIVIDLILGAIHFHVDAGADSHDVRKDISSDSAIDVSTV
jgi:hypothetical protein